MAVAMVLGLVHVAKAATFVAGVLGPVQVVSAKLTKKMSFPTLGLTSYQIIVTVESSNACMVPEGFVQESSPSNEGAYTLTGVYAQGGCSGELDPVTTEVEVGDYVVSNKMVPSVTVNGITAVLQD